MSSNTSGSRLAMVANQRRKERRKQAAAVNKNNASNNNNSNNSNNASSQEFISNSASSQQRENKENKNKYSQQQQQQQQQIQIGLTCAPTLTSVGTFDDSTFSSNGLSTFTEDTFTEDTFTKESYNFAPPMMILSPSNKYHNNSNNNNKHNATANKVVDNKPIAVVTTPRRRNVGFNKAQYQAKLRSNGNSLTPATTISKSSAINGSSISSPRNTPQPNSRTPKSNSLSRNRLRSGTSLMSSASAAIAAQSNSVSSTNNNSSNNSITSASSAADNGLANADLFLNLTIERDKLRSDVATFKRKLQHSIDTKNTHTREKDDTILTLESRLEEVSKELIVARAETKKASSLTRNATLSAVGEAAAKIREVEDRLKEEAKAKDAKHMDHLDGLQRRLKETDEELALMHRLQEELTSDKMTMDEKDVELKRELQQMKDERDRMEDDWKESLGKVDRMEMECEEKNAMLDQSLHALQNEKRSALADLQRQLSTTEHKLSSALSTKRDMEKSSRDQLSDLQNELKMQRNSTDNIKRHHATIVESLKSDVSKARMLREEGASLLQHDMEEMKKENDENRKYYMCEVENLRSQLRSTKTRADADRKEWTTNVQPTYDRRLTCVEKEKEALIAQLTQARKDISSLKSVRDKDIELLTSELDKTYKSKVETDAELMDVKRQLHNALRNLDEMAVDGGKMRCDLEGAMSDFTKEKQFYHKEISHLKGCNEEQRCELDDWKRENERYEGNCKELRRSVKELEDRLMKEMRANNEYKQHAEKEIDTDREALLLEIQYLKNKLEKSEEEVASKMASSVASAAMISQHDEHQSSELSQHRTRIIQLESEKLQLHTQIAQHTESLEMIRSAQRETSAELSRGQQTNQILRSKERYLESRVESLANQISKTVQDYEMRLSLSNSGISMSGSGESGGEIGESGYGGGGREMKQMGSVSREMSGSGGSSRFGSGKR